MSINLRTMLGLVAGLLLVAIAAVLVIVFQNVEATGEMRKEAREALLLAEMDTAVQQMAVEVDRWVSGAVPDGQEGHPVLDRVDIRGHVTDFETAATELEGIIKPAEIGLVVDMRRMFADYQAALHALYESQSAGLNIMSGYHAEVQGIERAFREALLDLQNEEIEHLAESTAAVRDAENLLRWLVPGLLVMVIILSFGIRRLASRAQRLDEMEALNEARNSFIASVSHELRTPLTAVVGLAHEMRDGLPSFNATEIQEFAGLIAEESGEVASIVEDLLVAARSEAGSLTVVQEDVDLRAQVEQLLRMDRVVDGRNVIVTANGSAVATADGARVRQILRNLLTNAARYGGENIEVGVEPHNGKIRLFVADDGPGIPEQDRERIFEPYQRAHQVPGVPASVGLGLTVSRHLARAMGGDLSYRYDGRSVLELVLPAAEARIPA